MSTPTVQVPLPLDAVACFHPWDSPLPRCSAMVQANGDWWVCTRLEGHEGPHVAHWGTGETILAWRACTPDELMDEGL